jgi:hypothetical protein
MANDMGSAHGLDAVSVNNWVSGTHDNRGPEGDNTTPFVKNPSTSQHMSGPDSTNVTESVRTNVDPCTRPFDTTMLPNPEHRNVLRQHLQHLQSTSSTNILNQPLTTGKMFPAVSSIVTGLCKAVFAVSGRLTAPRTSGLNVRSHTVTNIIPVPLSHARPATPHINYITYHTPHTAYHHHTQSTTTTSTTTTTTATTTIHHTPSTTLHPRLNFVGSNRHSYE